MTTNAYIGVTSSGVFDDACMASSSAVSASDIMAATKAVSISNYDIQSDIQAYTVSSCIDAIKPRDVLDKGVKTVLKVCKAGFDKLFVEYMKNGYKCSNNIMPDIQDVNPLIDNKVVIVTFTDGSSEKAVLTGSDTYSLEQGVSICITKKLLSDKSNGNGSNLYNKIIDRAVKKYNKAQKEKQKAEDQKKAAEAKYQKLVAKKAAKKAKRLAAEREAKIEIQKEAIIRAMQELNNASEEQK